MARKDYIEKINQNLEHLTKDELKDVSILTTAQYGVRLKVAEKEYIEKEIANLTPQLQQQTLPVVPECVGNMIEYAKKTEKTIRWFFTEDAYMFPEAMDWYAGSVKGLVDEIYGERQCSLINAFITGKYEVEKPQLFYLKHIDMSETDKEFDHYLIKTREGGFISSGFNHSKSHKGQLPDFNDCFEFTQSDIDSMNTGSYEQIEVTE